MLKNAFKKHPLQNRTNVQIKRGGGVKGLLNNVKKNCTFWNDGFPNKVTKNDNEEPAKKYNDDDEEEEDLAIIVWHFGLETWSWTWTEMSHSACHEVTKSTDKESAKKVDVDDDDA